VSLAVEGWPDPVGEERDALRGALSQAEEIVTALKGVLPEDSSADEEDQDQTSGKEPPPDRRESRRSRCGHAEPVRPPGADRNRNRRRRILI
jgi:hypothetical protein